MLASRQASRADDSTAASPRRHTATPASVLSNVLVPGSGLIVLRREWLGAAIAILFCIFMQIWLVGWLLLPVQVPAWSAWACAAAAAAVWLGAQWLFLRRSRAVAEAHGEAALLRARAAEALAGSRPAEAYDLLRAAWALNDEDIETNRRLAELLTHLRRRREAARAWRRVIQLETDPHARQQAVEALTHL